MKIPTITEIPTSRDNMEEFRGYNHNIRISENEFYDMGNLTSSNYPVLSPRVLRGTYPYAAQSATHSPNGIISKDNLCYVDGTKLYIGNNEVTGLTLVDSPKQLISIGAYIIIMPDKKYVNTNDTTEYGNIESTFESSTNVSYSICKADGSSYGNTIPTEKPESPNDKDMWIDNTSSPSVLKQYSENSSMWVTIATTYVRISTPNIGNAFSQYDGVYINGIDSSIYQLQDLNGKTSVLYEVYHDPGDTNEQRAEGTNDYIVVVGIIDASATQTSKLTVKRQMPLMDFVIESGNRLWGCRYGKDASNNTVNEIYCSKLGDFKNWNVFMGLSTDSYTASCGTDGAFTGAITHLGYPIFFKENCLHKVYGNFPANFQIQTTECRGVQKGAGRSLAIVNETLFYKSRTGVMAYDGSLPAEISACFGEIRYTSVDDNMTDKLRNGAVAGSINNKYYISMKSEVDSAWHLFAYDTSIGLWHREDNTRADAFCLCRGELYYIDNTSKLIRTVLGSGTQDVTPTEWYAETGIIGISTITKNRKISPLPDKKYISRMLLRLSMSIGSRLDIYAKYDDENNWNHLCRLTGNSVKSFSVPIKPKRCDHFRLKFVGIGNCKIFSICKTMEQGSDL